MNFGFDIDDTITAEPGAFSALMAALVSGGQGVHVITGAIPGVTRRDLSTEKGREEQPAGIGLTAGTHYTKLHLAIGKGAAAVADKKRQLCVDLDIALMFEDRSD